MSQKSQRRVKAGISSIMTLTSCIPVFFNRFCPVTSDMRVSPAASPHRLGLTIRSGFHRAATGSRQAVVLVAEALSGLVTGLQGAALLARLTKPTRVREEEEAEIAELVNSGKARRGFVTFFFSFLFSHAHWPRLLLQSTQQSMHRSSHHRSMLCHPSR